MHKQLNDKKNPKNTLRTLASLDTKASMVNVTGISCLIMSSWNLSTPLINYFKAKKQSWKFPKNWLRFSYRSLARFFVSGFVFWRLKTQGSNFDWFLLMLIFFGFFDNASPQALGNASASFDLKITFNILETSREDRNQNPKWTKNCKSLKRVWRVAYF